jgi:hypothetical protein
MDEREFKCYSFTPFFAACLPPGFRLIVFMFSPECSAAGEPWCAIVGLN